MHQLEVACQLVTLVRWFVRRSAKLRLRCGSTAMHRRRRERSITVGACADGWGVRPAPAGACAEPGGLRRERFGACTDGRQTRPPAIGAHTEPHRTPSTRIAARPEAGGTTLDCVGVCAYGHGTQAVATGARAERARSVWRRLGRRASPPTYFAGRSTIVAFWIVTGSRVAPELDPTFSAARAVSCPSVSSPKTV